MTDTTDPRAEWAKKPTLLMTVPEELDLWHYGHIGDAIAAGQLITVEEVLLTREEAAYDDEVRRMVLDDYWADGYKLGNRQ